MITRRQFWKVGLKEAAAAAFQAVRAYNIGLEGTSAAIASSLAGSSPGSRYLRPPGAQAEAIFSKLCDACWACNAACRFKALGTDPGGRPAFWDLKTHPCYMCDGFPCIASCPTRALGYRSRQALTIGTAHILPERCSGTGCSRCVPTCRTQAIRLLDGTYRVDATLCNGCGVCLSACPSPGAMQVIAK